MALKLALVDDFTGELIDMESEIFHTVNWVMEGVNLTMDLNEDSYAKFREAIGPWLDASKPAAEVAKHTRAVERAKARQDTARELEAERTKAENSIKPITVKCPGGSPLISTTEAKRRKRNNHGFTVCDEKLVRKVQREGRVKIRSNVNTAIVYDLQKRVAPLGLQLRLENTFKIENAGSGNKFVFFGDIYAELPLTQ